MAPSPDGGELESPLLPPSGSKQNGHSQAYGKELDSEFHPSSADDGIDESLLNTGPDGLTSEEAERRLAQFGKNELTEKKVSPWIKLLKSFIAPIPIMIWIAIVVEIFESDWPDFLVLLALQLLNSFIGWYEELKAGNAIEALKKSLQPITQVKRNGRVQKMDATLLVPGDIVILAAGAAVPADCKLTVEDYILEVDQSALTGESLPVSMTTGDIAKMGSNVVRGEVEAVVAATGSNTFFGKTADMISSVDEISNFQKVLIRITLLLMMFSFLLVGICLIYLLYQGSEDFLEAVAFSVVLLVASIPIAMQMVCTTTMALGCKKLAEKKAIVSRLASVEELASMTVLCCDKTGTLTMNKMVLQECIPYDNDYDRTTILRDAALAARWTEPPKDALDTLVLNSVDFGELDQYTQVDYLPFDPKIKRTEGTIARKDNPSGKVFKCTKGAPQVILELCSNKEEIRENVEAKILELAKRGIRALSIARGEPNPSGDGFDFRLIGILTFLDPPRPDTKETIENANKHGVTVKMITGDQEAIAKEMCRMLGLGQIIHKADNLPSYEAGQEIPRDLGEKYGDYIQESNGFAQVYPEHKFLIVEALRQRHLLVGMTGDGVNDAPALKKADVGIAVEGATDAARAAADIVLTEPGLSTIVDAIILSRMIFARMRNYVIYRIACTIQLLLFFFIALLCVHPWQAAGCEGYQDKKNHEFCNDFYYEDEKNHEKSKATFFKMPVIALVLITILNDGTIISIAYDIVEPSQNPEEWRLDYVFSVSTLLGTVAVVSSIILLSLGIHSHEKGSIFSGLNFVLSVKEVVAMMYLKISLSDFLTVFAARTESWFFSRKPARLLIAAFIVATTVSTIISCTLNAVKNFEPITAGLAAFVWFYCIVWFLIQDAAKVFLIRYLNERDAKKTSNFHEPSLLDETSANRPVGARSASGNRYVQLKNSSDRQAYQHQEDDMFL